MRRSGEWEDDEAQGAARELFRCPVCGAALWDGERIYCGHGTDAVLGCEHCVDWHDAALLARPPAV